MEEINAVIQDSGTDPGRTLVCEYTDIQGNAVKVYANSDTDITSADGSVTLLLHRDKLTIVTKDKNAVPGGVKNLEAVITILEEKALMMVDMSDGLLLLHNYEANEDGYIKYDERAADEILASWGFVPLLLTAEEVKERDAAEEIAEQLSIEDFRRDESSEESTSDHRKYRTQAGAVYTVDLPANMVMRFPSGRGYEYTLRFLPDRLPKGVSDPKSFLQIETLQDPKTLQVEDGTIFFEEDGKRINEAKLQDINTKEEIQNINLGLAQFAYSLMAHAYKNGTALNDNGTVSFYLPDLVRILNPDRHFSKDDIMRLVSAFQRLHNVQGVIKEELPNGTISESIYQVLNFESYDDKTNVITISSPYYAKDIKARWGLLPTSEPLQIEQGKFSYMLKPSLFSQKKSEAARQCVIVLTYSLEKAGVWTREDYHNLKNTGNKAIPAWYVGCSKLTIRMKTIIEGDLIAWQQYTENLSRRGEKAKRMLSLAFKYLNEDTLFPGSTKYKFLKLPQPSDAVFSIVEFDRKAKNTILTFIDEDAAKAAWEADGRPIPEKPQKKKKKA